MENYQVGSTQLLQVLVLDPDSIPVHGATVNAQIYRNEDNFYFDTVSESFISTGGSKNILLTELGTTGLYRASFDQSTDNGGVEQIYTVVYIISAPYASQTYDSLSFYDQDLLSIKGTGWDTALVKPSLIGLESHILAVDSEIAGIETHLLAVDATLTDIKGFGWDTATNKPNLMNIANKSGVATFDPVISSLEALTAAAENYNTEAF